MSIKFAYVWYGVDRHLEYYIIEKSTSYYRTYKDAETAAEQRGIDIIACHGGPYLLVIENPRSDELKKHLAALGQMLTSKQQLKDRSDQRRCCNIQ